MRAMLAAVTFGLAAPAGVVAETSEPETTAWVTMDDFESGSLADWRAGGGGLGGWFVYSDGDAAPDPDMVSVPPFAAPQPPEGEFAAISDMSGSGTFVLYRDVRLDGAFTLHLTAFYDSAAPLSSSATLRFDDYSPANQQFRIDVLDPDAPFDSIEPADVLVEVMRTDPGGALSLGPTEFAADLAALAGRTVRLRLATATNGPTLRAGVDAIAFEPHDADAGIAFPDTELAPGLPDTDGLTLPGPTGRHPVGLTTVRGGDPPLGEFVVSLWYPAQPGAGSEASYLTPEESRRVMSATAPVYHVPWDVLSSTHTHAVADARPIAAPLPLVVLLPGLAVRASSLSGLALELASHGYAVAGIEPSVEAFASPVARAAEASQALDVLLARSDIAIDSERIAVAGHSWGGEAVAWAMRDDVRFDVGVSFDTPFPATLTTDLDRPFLQLDTPLFAGHAYSPNWRHLTGPRLWLVVAGTVHMSVTDYPHLFEQFELRWFGEETTGERTSEIVRAYVVAFLDQHLLGEPSDLLDGPSDRFPEVTFQDPVQLALP